MYKSLKHRTGSSRPLGRWNNRIRAVFRGLLLLVALFSAGSEKVVAEESERDGELYWVKAPVTSVFADIYDDSERVTQVLCGEAVRVWGETEDNQFKEVTVSNQYREMEGYPGWIYSCYLTPDYCNNGNEVDLSGQPVLYPWKLNASASKPKQVMLIKPQVNVYERPDGQKVTTVLFASSVLALAESECHVNAAGQAYWQVLLPGRPGRFFIKKDEAVTETLPACAEDVLATAKLFKGSPYLWGGLSCHGIDCSGLVYVSCKLHGLIVPRDADQQFSVGIPLSRDELCPGDLVFFGKNEENVWHVGFYLGNGLFWDSSGKNGVGISSLDEPTRFRSFLGGRRYFEE